MNKNDGTTPKRWDSRCAGLLLHPTSLPGSETYWGGDTANAFGTLGSEAFKFVDFMAAANLSLWQVLPLGPTQDDLSPYQCLSVHAGNPELISLENLKERGWIKETSLVPSEKSPKGLRDLRRKCAKDFFNYLKQSDAAKTATEFKNFCEQQAYWLNDYALFSALRQHFNKAPWVEWPDEYRNRDRQALEAIKKELTEEIDFNLFEQFAFTTQWKALKDYANEKNIGIFGDMAIYVGHDSADVWSQPQNFKLDENGYPSVLAGVPPDSFSETGQCWGNPIYDWDFMQQDGFSWWLARCQSQMNYFDLIRIDHFRGFETCWEIPTDTRDARNGQWVKVPGESLLKTCLQKFPHLKLIAENLGMQADEAEKLREQFQIPGMHVLQFAFESDTENSHLPHNHSSQNIVYTGTHDNNTSLGWYKGISDPGKQQLINYSFASSIPMPWLLIDLAFSSVSKWAIIPFQDFLELDESGRMNVPSSAENNWRWKFSWKDVKPDLANSISENIKKYFR
jgi:4-alpha-glucanotransferase